jgi:thioredoxin reductase (NADPH)
MAEIYDLAILGCGPAAISAALTAKARNLKFIWFGNRALSDKVQKAELIVNYPGLTRVSGSQLQKAFLDQIKAEELEITEKNIHQIYRMGKNYALFSGQDFWTAKTLLLAVGTRTKAVIPGEAEYLGKGVSYCATCDGRLYAGKRIAVICESPKYEDEVAFLAGLAGEVLLYAPYGEPGIQKDNIRLLSEAPGKIAGEDLVTGIQLKKSKEILPVDGVFFLKDAYSPMDLLPEIELEENHIRVDRQMRTSLPGCFAAGDCTGRPYQYAKAVGEGNVAVHSILEYLHEEEQPCQN